MKTNVFMKWCFNNCKVVLWYFFHSYPSFNHFFCLIFLFYF